MQVLERHTVAGGCASFYQRAGYRFDVGATLVAGFGPRGVHRRVFAALGVELAAEPVDPAFAVHLPGETVVRYGDARWKGERLRAFGPAAEPFWNAQERIADRAWDFAAGLPALPAGWSGVAALAGALRPAHLALLPLVGRTVGSLFGPQASAKLRAFVDAQLLITAQADAAGTDLLYGATALDLAREGTYHLAGGISAIATALARAVRRAGGAIAYATEARALALDRGRVAGVVTPAGTVRAGAVISALPLGATALLLEAGGTSPAIDAFHRRGAALPQRWGAFTVYAGLPAGAVPDDALLHHQVVTEYGRPLGEGVSAFISISGPHERGRARNGGRAVTLSTHTDVARWERAARRGNLGALRRIYERRLLAALDAVVPGSAARAELVESGTPLTFLHYTGRPRGLVGGVPQTQAHANLRAASHASGIAGLTLCGDTTFPGQSTVGATLSGIAAARAAGGQFSLSSSRSRNFGRSTI